MSTDARFTAALATHRWDALSSQDFAHIHPARAVAVLPLGATEQHGPHLPLNVDTVLVDGVVRDAMTHLDPKDPVLVLPTQTVGLSTEHIAFAGTLTLSPQTVISQWCEIGASVARGDIEIGFQQMSELMPVPGIDIVGGLPKEIEEITYFATGRHASSPVAGAADALTAFFKAPAAHELIRAKGMNPA